MPPKEPISTNFIEQETHTARRPQAGDEVAVGNLWESYTKLSLHLVAVYRAIEQHVALSGLGVTADKYDLLAFEQVRQWVGVQLADPYAIWKLELGIGQYGLFDFGIKTGHFYFNVLIRSDVLAACAGLLGDLIEQVGIDVRANAEAEAWAIYLVLA